MRCEVVGLLLLLDSFRDREEVKLSCQPYDVHGHRVRDRLPAIGLTKDLSILMASSGRSDIC